MVGQTAYIWTIKWLQKTVPPKTVRELSDLMRLKEKVKNWT